MILLCLCVTQKILQMPVFFVSLCRQCLLADFKKIFVNKEACDQYRSYFIGQTKKVCVINASEMCYLQCL